MSSKQLRIALVSDSVLPFHKGGKETRTYHLSKELVRLGQIVDIYTMKWWDGPKSTYTHEGVTYHALCRLYPLYTGGRRSIKEGVMFGLACFKMLAYDFDVVETDHMPYFPLFSTKIVTLLKRKPLYATWHEVVGWKAWKAYIGFSRGLIAYLIERTCVKLPDHIVAVSDNTLKQLKETLHYKGQLSLVSNGIDYANIKPIAAATTKSDIVYAGRLIPHKNVDLLIETVALLKPDHPKLTCVIIGTGPEHKKLQGLVKKYGLENNITMLGRLELSDDVYAYMKASQLFVSPSIREGFGITVLEAIACGLSVVTVNHHDNLAQYLVSKKTGIVCDTTAPAIATSIQTLLASPRTSTDSINAASYDWSQQASALSKAYGL
jgi:glycosyltransferase involved in cell wall biosynthesis